MDLWCLRHRANEAAARLKKGDIRAIDDLEVIARSREELGDRLGAGSTWGNVGVARYMNGEIDRALACWEKQLLGARETGDTKTLAIVNDRIGAALQQSGAWESARLRFENARLLAEIAGAASVEIRASANLTLLLTEGGWIARARETLDSLRRRLASLEPNDEERGLVRRLGERLEIECGRSPYSDAEIREILGDERSDCTSVELALRSLVVKGEMLGGDGILDLADEKASEDEVIGLLFRQIRGLSGEGRGVEVPRLEALHRERVTCDTVAAAGILAEIAIQEEARGPGAGGHLVEEVHDYASKTGLPGIAWKSDLALGLKLVRKGDRRTGLECILRGLGTFGSCFGEEALHGDSGVRRREIALLADAVGKLGQGTSRAGAGRGSATGTPRSLLLDTARAALAITEDDRRGEGRYQAGMRKILEVTETLNSTRELDRLLEQILDSVLDLSSAEHGFVVLLDEKGAPTVKVARGEKSGEEEPRSRISQTVVGRVCRDRRAVLIGNALDDEDLLSKPSVRSLSLRSIMCAPLVHKEKLLGVVYLDNCSAVGTFAEEDLRLLEVFANQAAVAIQNTKLFGDLEQSYRALEDAHDRIVRSERLKVLGEMAGGVAHDFNNLLTSILVRAQLLAHEVEDSRIRRELGLIETAALDGASAIRRIQDFTRVRTDSDFAPFNLRDALLDAIEFTRGRWRQGRTEDGRRPWNVSLDGCPSAVVNGNVSEIREVFTNIILNGIEAMEHGGELEVRAETDGRLVRVEFADEGSGMSKETLDRIFDPFFSTKGERGNGLGLSVAYGIVSRHGGEIAVTSEPGVGSTFLVSLPVVEEPNVDEAGKEEIGAGLGGLEILLVDDEELVRLGVERLLAGLGCSVEAVAGAERALELLDRRGFDLVLTDHRMAGMSGAELFGELRRRGNSAPVLVMTGSATELDLEALGERGVTAVLRKPFTLSQLAEAIERVRNEASGKPAPRTGTPASRLGDRARR